MTKDDTNSRLSPELRMIAIGLIGGIISLFLLGVLAGYSAAVFESDSFRLVDFTVISVILLLLIGTVLACRKLWPKPDTQPVAESTRKSNKLVLATLAVSGALGTFMSLSIGPQLGTVFSNEPIPPLAAAIIILGFLIALPVLTGLWLKTIDEHEIAAYRDGAFWSAHAYLIGVPVWWIASRAGWVPQQDPMIVFVFISILWCAIWLYRRYA